MLRRQEARARHRPAESARAAGPNPARQTPAGSGSRSRAHRRSRIPATAGSPGYVPVWIQTAAPGVCVGLNVVHRPDARTRRRSREAMFFMSLAAHRSRSASVLLERERATASDRRSGARCADRPTRAAGPDTFTSAGLGSNISTCDGPPERKRLITCLALPGVRVPA